MSSARSAWPLTTRRGVRARAAVVLAAATMLIAVNLGASAEGQTGPDSSPTSVVIGGTPETAVMIGGRPDAGGDPADQVLRGENDGLGVLLMGRLAEMPEVKPPEFFEGPAEPNKPSGPPYKTGPNERSPVVIPPPALGVGDGTIYAVGDSVLLGTEHYLPTTTAGWDLRMDARVSRTFPEGISVVQANRRSVGQVAVVVLGHNYGGGNRSAGYIDTLMSNFARTQRVVFVTVTEWQPAQAEVNRSIYAAAQRYPNIVVAPWAETVAANPEFLVDNVHPNTAGRVALANLIAVMVGPVPPSDGNPKPPRPVILPIPPVVTTTTTPPRGTTTTLRSVTTLPDESTSTTSITTPGTSVPPTSETTASSTTTTVPP